MASRATTASPIAGSGTRSWAPLPISPAVLVSVFALAVAGAALIWYATSWGPWAFSDSVSYVEAARNLAGGRGLVEITASGMANPFVKQPPLYPFLLAIATVMGAGTVDAARWLDIGLFAALVLVLGLLASTYSPRPWLYMALPIIVVTSPLLLENYTGVMSEPVFLTLGFLGLVLVVAYLQNRNRPLLLLSAAAVGLAAMTRYAGVVLIFTSALAIWMFEKTSAKRRLWSIATFCLISATPLLLWTYTQVLHTGLQAESHLPAVVGVWTALRPLREGLYSILWSWLPFAEYIPIQRFPIPPWRLQLLALALVALVPIVLLALAFQRQRHLKSASTTYPPDLQLAAIFILVSLVHICFMAFVSLFGPWEVGIDARQLLPIFIFGCAGIFLAIGLVPDKPAPRKMATAAQLLVAAALVFSALPQTAAFVENLHANGRGYTGKDWHDTALMQAVAQLPSNTVIISNDIEGIMFHTRRPAFRLPELQTGVPAPLTQQFGSQPGDRVERLFSQGTAVLVMFDAANWRFNSIYKEETATRLQSLVRGLHRAATFPDGAIYYYVPPLP